MTRRRDIWLVDLDPTAGHDRVEFSPRSRGHPGVIGEASAALCNYRPLPGTQSIDGSVPDSAVNRRTREESAA